MASFTVKIDTNNAAFEGANAGVELATILRRLADRLERGIDNAPARLFDTNGNKVGEVSIFD